MAFSWDLDTRPFADANGAQPARFSLRQVDDDTFELSEPFLYTGGPRAGPIPVTSELLGRPTSRRSRASSDGSRVEVAATLPPHSCTTS